MKTVVLKLYGDIAEDLPEMFMGEGANTISAKFVSEFLDANQDATNITVRINSRGGDVQEGWTIHDLLTTSGKKIKTIGEGKIYSIATVIFLAGSEREIMRNADGIIHNPFIPPYTMSGQYGSGDLEEIAGVLKQEEAKMLAFYVERTGSPADKLAQYMSDNTMLSAEDMVTLGFATKILEPIKAFAYIKPKNKIAMTENDVKTWGEKLDLIVAKISAFTRLTPVDQMMKDKDGKEFKLEKESGSPAIGDKASPDGTYVMADGKTITITAGAVASVDDVEEMDEMAKATETIAALQARIGELEAAQPNLIAAEAAFREKETQAVAIAAELGALRNSWKPDTRTRFSAAEKVGGIDLSRVKELSDKLNQ
jgi:ATP-dependent protease ClpP protease subunit